MIKPSTAAQFYQKVVKLRRQRIILMAIEVRVINTVFFVALVITI